MKDSTADALISIATALVILVLVFFGFPWLLFFSIETLFGVPLDYTWKTWLAAWAFMICVNGGSARKK